MADQLDPLTGAYHPKSLMPNLQLAQQEAADIASWLLSVPGEWPVTVDVLALDSKEVKEAVDELVKLYISKSGSFKTADGKSVTKSLSRDRRIRHEGPQAGRQAVLPGREDDFAAGLFRLPHASPASRTPSRSGPH